MKSTIELDKSTRKSLLSSTETLVEKFKREIPMLRKSITAVPNVEKANNISFHFASTPLLIRLALLDLCTLFKLFLLNESDTEKNVLIRLISGQLYEFSEDVQEIFGKQYRALLKEFDPSEDLINEFNSNVIKKFHSVKNNHSKFLKIIRHNVSHHKDIDALWQYYLINEIDYNWTIKAYSDFVEWYLVYNDFELKLIDIASKQMNS